MKKIPLFVEFGDDDLQKILTVSELKIFEDGDIIISEGDRTDRNIYVMFDGQAHIFVMGKNKKIVLNVLNGTGVFGEMMSVYGLGQRSASIMANTRSTILIIDNQKFKELTRKEARLGMFFYKNLCFVLADKLMKTDILLKHTIEWGW